VESLENQNQVFHPSHRSLEISQRRRDSHIPTAPAVCTKGEENGGQEEVWAMEKWKSKGGIPTFPQPRQPAAQGRRLFKPKLERNRSRSANWDHFMLILHWKWIFVSCSSFDWKMLAGEFWL
jgi:hypothetical protein